MNFVHNPTLIGQLGKSTVRTLEDTTEPWGECMVCQQELGHRPLRLTAQVTDTSAIVAAIHAHCGTGPAVPGLTVIVPATNRTVSTHEHRVRTGQVRSWLPWRKRTITHERHTLAVLHKPSGDIFNVSRDNTASPWSDPRSLDFFTALGFSSSRDEAVANPIPLTAEVAGGELSFHLGIDLVEMTFPADASALVSTTGGALICVTYETLPTPENPDALANVLTSEWTVFAWLPASQITGLDQ